MPKQQFSVVTEIHRHGSTLSQRVLADSRLRAAEHAKRAHRDRLGLPASEHVSVIGIAEVTPASA
jgi:hypothetical protein